MGQIWAKLISIHFLPFVKFPFNPCMVIVNICMGTKSKLESKMLRQSSSIPVSSFLNPPPLKDDHLIFFGLSFHYFLQVNI